jgi:hypothetical protein
MGWCAQCSKKISPDGDKKMLLWHQFTPVFTLQPEIRTGFKKYLWLTLKLPEPVP